MVVKIAMEEMWRAGGLNVVKPAGPHRGQEERLTWIP